jgi:hypothetical protein
MRNLFVLVVLASLFAAACSCNGRDGVDGTSCSVVTNADNTATVSCSDGTKYTVASGKDGANGTSCSVAKNVDGSVTVTCPDGTTVTIGQPSEECSAVSRAVLAKTVIIAIDGMASYTAPKTPTYTDVQPGDWYYGFVEAATQLGIMSGYTDASGNVTEKFGPGDTASRDQVVKVLVNAFSLPAASSEAIPFTDVVSDSWYSDYVKSAYKAGVLTDNGDHLFRPSDPADSCWLAQVIHRAANPVNPLCPNLTRQAAIDRLYVSMGLGGCSVPSCTDVSSPASCSWGALQDVGVVEAGSNCRPNNSIGRADFVKLVVIAIDGLADYEAPATPTFADAPKTSWFFDYVEAAVQLGLVGGGTNFFPANPADACWADQMLSKAFGAKAALEISLGTNTPVAAVVLKGATGVKLATYCFSAANVMLNAVTVTRGGVGSANDWRSFHFIDEGGGTVSNSAALVSDAVRLTVGLKVSGSRCFTLVGDLMSTATVENQHYFYVAKAGDVDIGAKSVAGDFPIAGNTFAVGNSGTLSVVSEGNPEGGIVVAGSPMQLASKYRFTALGEGFNVNRLTVINDVTGPFDTSLDTVAVNSVVIRYSDINGVSQVKTGSLSSGSVTFSGLDFYVPAGQDAFVEIFNANNLFMVDVGEFLSGKVYRLGILDTGNTVSTFEAVGATSLTPPNTPAISGGATVNPFTVRKSKPTFSKMPGLITTLADGENRLYAVSVCADVLGSVGFGRFKFEVIKDASVSLADFKFYKASTLLSGVTLTSVGNAVIVAFDQEEIVGSGQCQYYYLHGTATGVTLTSSVTTKLVLGTGSAFSLPNPCANPNTGYVYGLGGTSIFVNASGFVSEDVTGAEFVWSDMSSDTHSYPVIANGLVTAGSGSCDWTNGYALGSLPAHTLIR